MESGLVSASYAVPVESGSLRLRRRWAKIAPTPAIPLGSLRRRYHANLAGYLYEPRL